jgi:protein-tyrosine-phosphatase
MKKRYHVLFVCSGNTCRSPLAEALLRRELKKRDVAGVSVSSAGISALPGQPAAEHSRRVARELGASLAGFKSSPLSPHKVAVADLILTMEARHLDTVLEKWPGARARAHVLSKFSGSGRGGIPDPVGKPLEAYRECGLALSDEVSRVMPKLRKLVSARRKK